MSTVDLSSILTYILTSQLNPSKCFNFNYDTDNEKNFLYNQQCWNTTQDTTLISQIHNFHRK
jgi:hypothetical protein